MSDDMDMSAIHDHIISLDRDRILTGVTMLEGTENSQITRMLCGCKALFRIIVLDQVSPIKEDEFLRIMGYGPDEQAGMISLASDILNRLAAGEDKDSVGKDYPAIPKQLLDAAMDELSLMHNAFWFDKTGYTPLEAHLLAYGLLTFLSDNPKLEAMLDEAPMPHPQFLELIEDEDWTENVVLAYAESEKFLQSIDGNVEKFYEYFDTNGTGDLSKVGFLYAVWSLGLIGNSVSFEGDKKVPYALHLESVRNG